MDEETISAAVWLAILTSDRESFKKLMKSARKLGSSPVRIIVGRVFDAGIVEKDSDKVEETLVSLAKYMKIADYVSLRKKVFTKYGKRKYSAMFDASEEKFGILSKKKLENEEQKRRIF
jgi:hypothetical protein